MNPPSLDPPPDDTYPGFADRNKDRRTIVFTGTNRGIIEAIDGRIGKELWGFIPFNLLPKLKSIRDGESVGSFEYFADGSPKISDIKLADGTWRTY
jgi:Tfp pilus tip-associated adhesin PilY1